MAKVKRSAATKAKARVKRATRSTRKKVARAVAPKRKRRAKPKSMVEKVGAAVSKTVDKIFI